MDASPQTPPPAGPPPPPPFGSPRPRQLRRRPDEGPLGGVCAGVAEYFRIDPLIVRIAAVVLAVSGPGVIAYVLAWIFVPAEEGPPSAPGPGHWDRRDRGAQVFGLLLLAVAASVLWGGWWSPTRRWLFPLGLIVLGGWLVLRRERDDEPGDATSIDRAAGPPDVPTPTAGTATPSPGPDDTSQLPRDEGDTTTPGADASWTDPTGGRGGGQPPWGAGPWHWRGEPAPSEEVMAARRRRRMVFPIVLGALLVWMGTAFLADVSVQTGLAVALCIVGIGFVCGAFVGGSKALIVPAVLVGAALVTTSVLDLPLDGPIGQRSWTPQAVDEIEGHYELSMGEGTLDLTQLPLPDGEEIAVDASIGLGHLVVIVPQGAALEISAHASAGDTLLLGVSNSGIGVDVDRSYEGDPDVGSIHLDLEVGMGQIEVREQRVEHGTTTTSSTLG